MPAKRYMRGSLALRALLLCMLFLLFGPTTAPASVHGAAAVSALGARSLAAAAPTSVTVTTTSDVADGDTTTFASLIGHPGADGAISLREAILASNSTATGTPLTIAFDIPSGTPGHNAQNGTWTITLGAQALPPLTHGSVTIDGTTQPGAPGHPQIVLDGFNVYEAAGLSNGLTITSSHNTIRGLTLANFYDDAVLIDGPNAAYNQIAGCYLGPDADGEMAAQPSYFGVELRNGAHDNLIGGASSAARNLIAGNAHSGILIQSATSYGNTVAGNWIGTDATGDAALKNAVAGVLVSSGAHDNSIGGAGQGNLISGNDTGVYIDGGVATTIAGNTIGLAADGQTPLGNSNGGIFGVRGARDNVIGGTSAALRNIISGNGASSSAFGQAIYLSDANTANNTIQGNYIGVDTSGTRSAGNYRQGVLIAAGAQGNLIGGTAPGTSNVIAYNGLGGIRVDAPGNQIAGNLIGVGADGATPLGNQFNGVRVGGDNNVIGPYNLIAHNQQSGILLSGSNTTVLSNTLVSNARSGICVAGPNATIRGNLIQLNGDGSGPWSGCAIRGGVVISDTDGTLLTANDILSNDNAGVTVYGGRNNRILSNSISDNQAVGIRLTQGGNNEIAPPRISTAHTNSISGVACSGCHVEIFTDTSDEGRYFVGATTAAGDGSFHLTVAPDNLQGPHITATHTDGDGNTSPFAAAISWSGNDPSSNPDSHVAFFPLLRK
ncbi:MAG TPA: right-handed parallel beta-helix repeat-containing protein [Roseiflexaceae bacterium]